MSSDIILCPGQGCPIKENCYRYTTEVLGRQDFFGLLPYDFASQSCTYFMDNRPERIRHEAYALWLADGQIPDQSLHYWLLAEKRISTSNS